MSKKTVDVPGLPTPKAPYSYGIEGAGLVFVAGMVGTDKAGALVGKGDIRAQTRQTIENIRAVLEAAGSDLGQITKTTVYLTDFAHYAGMNEVYREYFQSAPPARATVRADLVSPDFLVEIEAIALKR